MFDIFQNKKLQKKNISMRDTELSQPDPYANKIFVPNVGSGASRHLQLPTPPGAAWVAPLPCPRSYPGKGGLVQWLISAGRSMYVAWAFLPSGTTVMFLTTQSAP